MRERFWIKVNMFNIKDKRTFSSDGIQILPYVWRIGCSIR
jgi:hypothetical protein